MPTSMNINSVVHTYQAPGPNAVFTETLKIFAPALSITNSSAHPVKVYFNKYTPDNITVPANSVKEIATTTNWYQVVFDSTAVANDTVTVITVQMAGIDSLLAPLFPNLIDTSPVGNLQQNPINAGGFTWEPWAVSDGSNQVLGNDNIVKVEYYLNGQSVASNSTDFYKDFYNLIISQINAFYPANYVNPTNPAYSVAATADVTNKVRQFFEGLNLPLNDEFFGGWASMTTYDPQLALTSFALNSTNVPNLGFPYSVVGYTITNTGTGNATFTITNDANQTFSITLAAGSSAVIPTGISSGTITPTADGTTGQNYSLTKINVSAGTISLTFSGFAVKLITFAPILNIVYPLGFNETSGLPNTAYLTFVNALAAFKTTLQANHFTGRVVYLKAIPFEAQESPVWEADYVIPQIFDSPYNLVWSNIRDRVPNWISRSKMEDDTVKLVAHENSSLFYGSASLVPPSTLDDILNNDSVLKFLGNDVSSLPTPTDRKNKKIDLLTNWLLNEYLSGYSQGGVNFFINRGSIL